MPKRSYSSAAGYRYGFNGKENDNDAKGLGNQQDYGMRIYDPRLGRFLTVDPISRDYPWNSPYSFAENDVIRSKDLDGLEKLIIHETYDKYGRVAQTEISGIRDRNTKEATEMDMKSVMGVKLSKQDVYILRHRRSGRIFFEGPAGSLTSAQRSQISSVSGHEGIQDDHLPPGTMQRGEATSRGRFYISSLLDYAANEFFDAQFRQQQSTPIIDQDYYFGDFVTGTITSGEGTGTSLGLAPNNATNFIETKIEGFVNELSNRNRINIAFVENITITLNNNEKKASWDVVRKKLSQKYNIPVRIIIDPNLQQRQSGAVPLSRVSGTVARIDYQVSGVKDGNANKAEPGAINKLPRNKK